MTTSTTALRHDPVVAADDLPKIGAPATRALASIGVTRLDQLVDHTEAELLALIAASGELSSNALISERDLRQFAEARPPPNMTQLSETEEDAWPGCARGAWRS